MTGTLLHVLGVGFGVAIIIGTTVGLGILRMPGVVAAQLGDWRLILAVWLAGAIYALLGALSLAELGTMLPEAGGFYVYARRAFGDFAGFLVGWTDWAGQCAALAYLTFGVAEYAAQLSPVLAGWSTSIAAGTLLLFTALQWRGLRWGSGLQQLMSALLGVAFLLLIASCFLRGAPPEARTATSFAAPSFAAWLAACQAVFITYDGWQTAVYFSEENREPARSLPRALLLGVLSVGCLYLLLNAALLYSLPLAELAASRLAAATAAESIFGAAGGKLIAALAIVTLVSCTNAVLLQGTRVPFAMSRDRLFWSAAASVRPGGTPGTSLLLTAGCALLLLLSGTFERTIALAAFFFVASYCASFLALLVLRRREPDLRRPVRVLGYPWTPLAGFLAALLYLAGSVSSDTANSLFALGVLAVSFPAYRWMKGRMLS